MKVRLEIIDDDGTESTSVEFAGGNWKRRLLAFLDTYEDETNIISEPSSNSSNFSVNVAEQSAYQSQLVQQQQAVNYQQQVPTAQLQPQQVQMNASQAQYSQLPVQQSQIPVQMPIMPQPQVQQQFQQAYAQQQPTQPVIQNYQLPQFIPPSLPPMRAQQYGYEQPAPPTSYTVRQTMNPSQSPAAPHIDAFGQAGSRSTSNQRRAPSLHDRMNDTSLTINERLVMFLKYEYPRIWFSSQDIQKQYERIYGEIKQSTVSTYLSRMFRKNLLARRGNRTQREYRYIADELEPESDLRMDNMSEMPLDYRLRY